MAIETVWWVLTTNAKGEEVDRQGPYKYKGVAQRKWEELADFVARAGLHLQIAEEEREATSN